MAAPFELRPAEHECRFDIETNHLTGEFLRGTVTVTHIKTGKTATESFLEMTFSAAKYAALDELGRQVAVFNQLGV